MPPLDPVQPPAERRPCSPGKLLLFPPLATSTATGGGQMQLQRRPRESLTPQQLREWYTSWGCGGSRRSCRPGAGQLGESGIGQLQLQRRPRETLTSQQLHKWYAQSRGSLRTVRCPYVIRTGDRTGQTCGPCQTWSSAQATPLATGHSHSETPSDESVEPSGPYPELVGCLMYLMTCTRPDLAYPLGLLARYVAPGRHRKVHMDVAKRVLRYLCSTSGMGLVLGGRGDVVLTGHSDASWVNDQATQWSSQGYTFTLGSGSVSWRSTHSSSVLSSSCEAEIYATAMAAQELRWLTYLLTDLGERPRSPPVLYVDNKAAIALCQEQRLEHRTKHIALRYFLARELQQRGQLRLAHVATRANTVDIFTKALPPGDHQRLCTLLGLVPTLPHLL
ncbi:unnamed protein product [Closterium sp. NIES-53]